MIWFSTPYSFLYHPLLFSDGFSPCCWRGNGWVSAVDPCGNGKHDEEPRDKHEHLRTHKGQLLKNPGGVHVPVAAEDLHACCVHALESPGHEMVAKQKAQHQESGSAEKENPIRHGSDGSGDDSWFGHGGFLVRFKAKE